MTFNVITIAYPQTGPFSIFEECWDHSAAAVRWGGVVHATAHGTICCLIDDGRRLWSHPNHDRVSSDKSPSVWIINRTWCFKEQFHNNKLSGFSSQRLWLSNYSETSLNRTTSFSVKACGLTRFRIMESLIIIYIPLLYKDAPIVNVRNTRFPYPN